MTTAALTLVLAFLGGLTLGLLHFGGLWLTVRHLAVTRRPWLVTLGSAVGRLGISLLGFYLVMRSGWGTLLACLGGFVAVRFFLLQRWRAVRSPSASADEVLHGHHTD
jgi:F1F0 ATPase subunit 2